LALAALVGVTSSTRAAPKEQEKPKVEVVFCLDTTGSMGGLIEGAKQKIWDISNQIANGKPVPLLKIGLVAYRDRGDAYVTQVTELSEDLDAIYGKLKGFQAQGGGDGPESVNQALDDAVHKIKWSEDKGTLKIIFLVGDAPPHMDYKDDVKYPDTCQAAVKKNIIINTIQCGGDGTTTPVWKDICAKAEGSFVQIQQSGGVVAIETPFDKRLGEINGEIVKCTLCYGCPEKQQADQDKNIAALKLRDAEGAGRIAFQAKNGMAASYDLIDNIKDGKVKLEDLKEEELPPELQKLKKEERKEYLAKLDQRRKDLMKEVVELDKKRSDYIAKKQAEMAKKGNQGFDQQVLEILRNQAAKNGIAY
jgi:hypothetical protein